MIGLEGAPAPAAHQSPDEEQDDDSTDEGDDDLTDDAGGGDAEQAEEPAAEQRADQAGDDVNHHAATAAFDDYAGQKASHEADQKPDEKMFEHDVYIPSRGVKTDSMDITIATFAGLVK